MVLPRPMSSARQTPKPSCSWKAIHETPRAWYGRSVPLKLLGGSSCSRALLWLSLLRNAASQPVASRPTTGMPVCLRSEP